LASKLVWKKGGGKLGVLAPIVGEWQASAETPMGIVNVHRKIQPTLSGSHFSMDVVWKFGQKEYVEHAIIGLNRQGVITFWSFTNDGKNSTGHLVEAPDIHPNAIAFQAEMPAGTARMTFFPDPDDASGMIWVVESKNQKGWNRFTTHHYKPVI